MTKADASCFHAKRDGKARRRGCALPLRAALNGRGPAEALRQVDTHADEAWTQGGGMILGKRPSDDRNHNRPKAMPASPSDGQLMREARRILKESLFGWILQWHESPGARIASGDNINVLDGGYDRVIDAYIAIMSSTP